MANRAEIRSVVSGLGTGMKVLELLIAEIEKQRGDPEILVLLTRKRFSDNLARIAEFATTCDWRIPASEMRALSLKLYRSEFEIDEERVEEAANLWWYAPMYDLGLPYDRYSNDPTDGWPALPPALKTELRGKVMTYPLLVGNKVVVNWDTKSSRVYKPGEIIDVDDIECLALADQKYFDFER